jgi:hypothetical protein
MLPQYCVSKTFFQDKIAISLENTVCSSFHAVWLDYQTLLTRYTSLSLLWPNLTYANTFIFGQISH